MENGLPLVRCANNGLTGWVDSRGRLREVFRDDRGTIYGAGFMSVNIPLLGDGEKRTPTFYHRTRRLVRLGVRRDRRFAAGRKVSALAT